MAWSDLEYRLSRQAVLCARDVPQLRGSIREARESGRLVAVLPGIYARAEVAGRLEALAAAAMACAPDGVIVRTAALALALPADVSASEAEGACRSGHVDGPHIRFTRRRPR